MAHHLTRRDGRGRIGGAIALGVVFALCLGGCATSTPGAVNDGAARAARISELQARVAELARDVGDARPSDIDGWARAVAAATTGPTGYRAGMSLIAIDALQSDDLNEPFGTLDIRVHTADNPAGNTETEDTGSYCFRVAFNYYGKVGEWSTSDGVASIDCPPNAPTVTPAPDETIVEVVAVNSREATHAVLAGQSGGASILPTVDQITSAITARLQPPTGTFTITAPPQVVIDPDSSTLRIGVAMGTAHDCVLVKSEDGIVSDVYPPAVLLQPGELGCSPSTALASDEQLRPPH